MSVGDIIAAGQQIYQAGNSSLSLANKYEERSASWNAFFGKVALLQATCERLNERVQSSEVSLLVSEVRAFEVAQRQVDAVVQTLKAGENMGNDRRTWALKIMFSEKVTIQLDAATKSMKELEEYFEEVQNMAEDVTKRRVQRLESRRAALTYSDPSMNLYIPFQDTERRILSALQESAKGGAQAVVVFGQGGQGKSSMVRHMASTLEQDVFGNVFFVECGRQADVAAIQTVLLQWLGADASSREVEGLEKQSGTKNSTTAVKSTKELLRLRLQTKRVLIMLDDVWNFDFLQEFLKLSGPSTTFLVTSPEDICKDTDMEPGKSYEPIQMETLKLDDAEQIFAVHAGLPGRRIPPDCKDIARGLFDRADYHPLVIAQLGAQLGKAANRLAMGIWEALVSDFHGHLDKKLAKPVSGQVYPVSFSGVTEKGYDEKGYDDLSDRAKHLIVLLVICKGPSVSDAVLHFLFQTAFPTLKCTKFKFSQMKFELQSRQLLSSSDESSTSIHDSVKDFIVSKLTEKVNDLEKTLNLHSLRKSHQFSLQELRNKIGYFARSFSTCCLEGNLDPIYQHTFQGKTARTRFITILSCLYLDPEFELTTKFFSQSGYSSATFSELKRITVKPITEKLVEELTFQSDSSSTTSLSPAIEVFLGFICNDSLLHGNISKLLCHKVWVNATLGFLGNLQYLDQSFWTKENDSMQAIGSQLLHMLLGAPSSDILEQAKYALWGLCACQDSTSSGILCTPLFLEKFGRLLYYDQNPILQSVAPAALANLASGGTQDVQKICNISTLLHHLVRSLAADQSSSLQEDAARAIQNLAATCDLSIKNVLGSFPNLLERLGECLTKKHCPKLQFYAVCALAGVAQGNDVCKSNIIQVTEMLHRLVRCVDIDSDSDLQEEAARALRNLAATTALSILNILGSFPNLLEGLSECLTKKDYPKLQFYAGDALAGVARGNDVCKSKIIQVTDMLDRLVQCLGDDGNSDLQEEAARALCNLTATRDLSILNVLGSFPNLLEGLGECLTKKDSAKLQLNAARALATVTWGNDDVRKSKIIQVAAMLDRLVRCLGNDNSDLQKWAALALWNLAATKDLSILNVLGNFPNLVEGLGECLTKKDYPMLQFYAGGALARVAQGNDVCKSKIIRVTHMLDRLVQCLGDDRNSNLQEEAAWALCNLAATTDLSILNALVSFPNLLKGLGECLTKKDCGKLQLNAAHALANVTWGNDDVRKSKIIQVAYMLDRLVRCLGNDSNSDFQKWAALALWNLAATRDLSILNVLGNFPNLVEGLAECMTKKDYPKLQFYAGGALADVARGNVVCKSKIIQVTHMLDRLVQCLGYDRNSDLQEEAAGVLCNLAATTDHSILNVLGSFPNLLEGLGECLTKKDYGKLQLNAVHALANVTWGNDDVRKSKIIQVAAMLDRLVRCLGNDSNSDLQKWAALALWNLAATKDLSILNVLGKFPNLLEGLGECMTKKDYPKLQVYAGGALADVARGNVVCKSKIIQVTDMLDRLVQCLGDDGNVDLQEVAARALCNLAGTTDLSILNVLGSFPNLLEGLGECLTKKDYAKLQLNATRAVANGTWGNDDVRKSKII